MPDQIVLSTWYARPLTRTEIQVFTFVEDERKAIMLSKFVVLPDNATYEQIEEAVTMALVRVKELASGCAEIEYIGGQRRDDKRVQ